MKIDRHDQAKILSSEEISRLFTLGLKSTRDRALFGVCLYTGTRIAEACSLHTKDVYAIDGSVRPRVTIRKGTTKGKIETRSVPVNPKLRALLVGRLSFDSTTFQVPPTAKLRLVVYTPGEQTDTADKLLQLPK